MNQKTTKFFSKPLMKQNIKSNYILTLVVIAIMCMMCFVSTYATSIMGTRNNDESVTEAQSEFYSYLYVMASYNEVAGTTLSYNDFVSSEDHTAYEQAFAMMNQQSDEADLTLDDLEASIQTLQDSKVSVDTYVHEFEYVYALGNIQGCFSGDDLSVDDMMSTMMETMGIEPDMLETMANMDTTALFNQMDYTVMGLLPIFLFIVIVGNSLIVDQVDRGSMAYVLSTPTKRAAVTNTQVSFLVLTPLLMVGITCLVRIAASFAFLDSVNVSEVLVLYLGTYILTEAIAGICYLGSCLFDQSKKAMSFGGGLTVWFFLASLLGMFGSEDMVSMGFGADSLGIFNKLTLVGLFDIKSISTIGSDNVDETFIWKLAILAVIAILCYAVGSWRFQKKDLPL